MRRVWCRRVVWSAEVEHATGRGQPVLWCLVISGAVCDHRSQKKCAGSSTVRSYPLIFVSTDGFLGRIDGAPRCAFCGPISLLNHGFDPRHTSPLIRAEKANTLPVLSPRRAGTHKFFEQVGLFVGLIMTTSAGVRVFANLTRYQMEVVAHENEIGNGI